MHIHFILHSPARAENVGAAARALKTMGFNSLRLIDSNIHQSEQATWVAHGSEDILQQAQYFSSIHEAIADCDLVIATTARKRAAQRRTHTPEAIYKVLKDQCDTTQNVGLLFGCESSGLSNDVLACADLLSYIPLAGDYPSLNLSQAVMLYAYQLSPLSLNSSHTSQQRPEDQSDNKQELAHLKTRIQGLLSTLGVTDDLKLKEWIDDSVGLFTSRDTRMLHTLISDLLKKL